MNASDVTGGDSRAVRLWLRDSGHRRFSAHPAQSMSSESARLAGHFTMGAPKVGQLSCLSCTDTFPIGKVEQESR